MGPLLSAFVQNQYAMRLPEIDRFRGLAVVSMVFFTMVRLLSDRLPDVLAHNIPLTLHLGDFVLPMFLFASGMSLVFFVRKRAGKPGFLIDLAERTGLLLMVWFLISPLSGGGVLQMDEIMLSVLLSLPTIALAAAPEIILAAAALAPVALYLVLSWAGMLPDFTAHYLGGYPAAPFYLPVMLCGALAARRIERLWTVFVPALAAAAVLLLIVPPYKLSASPSFMALSVVFSLAVFEAVKRLRSGWLEYLGTRSIRYWILMWIVVIVPLVFILLSRGVDFPLKLEWPEAVLASFLALAVIFLASLAVDRIVARGRAAAARSAVPEG